MKWYWWVIIVFVPLGLVAYFFYAAGRKKNEQLANARNIKSEKAAERKENEGGGTDTVVDPDTLKA